nr:MAG TPA: hypothetical protein [Caudoviricetes sp.]
MKSFDDFMDSINDANFDKFSQAVAAKVGVELNPHDDKLVRTTIILVLEYLRQYHEWLSK